MSNKKIQPKTPLRKPINDSLSGVGSLRPTPPTPQPTPSSTNTVKKTKQCDAHKQKLI